MYRDDTGFRLRVWDLNDGSERTVTVGASATAYFADANYSDVGDLTIADYTLLVNRNTRVSMSSDESTITDNEALVVIDQVSYNTTYNIDISDTAGAQNRSTALQLLRSSLVPMKSVTMVSVPMWTPRTSP